MNISKEEREKSRRDFIASRNERLSRFVPGPVPESVRPLLPFVQKYGIEIQKNFYTIQDFLKKQPDAALQEFCRTWENHRKAFMDYCDAQPRNFDRWSETASCFAACNSVYHKACEELVRRGIRKEQIT
jgi:hypothetical protein